MMAAPIVECLVFACRDTLKQQVMLSEGGKSNITPDDGRECPNIDNVERWIL